MLKPSEQCSFFQDDRFWGVTCLGLVDTWMFSYLCPWKHDTCVWKPSEQGLFFQDKRFEGSHVLVYSKNECFPIYVLRNPIKVVETLKTELVFLRWSIWGVTCLGLLSKWMSSHLSPQKTHKLCWNPQNRACFSEMINFEGSHA